MNNSYNNINIEKLKNTQTVMKNINNSLENTNISKYFLDIESILKKVNFEHGNCISDYRDVINPIIEKLNILKQNIKNLENSISITIEEFSTVEHKEITTEKNNSNILQNSSTSLTQITPVTTEQTESQVQTTQTTNEINTIPIGLGIAAAGITGSIGAVMVDSMKNNENHSGKMHDPVLEEYKSEGKENLTPSAAVNVQKEDVFQDVGPYHASRNSTVKNKFYENGITEYYEKEDQKPQE